MLLSIALTFLTAVAPITSQDRRSRDEPEMMVNAGGRAGVCDVLAFDAAGKWLFAAGDDKVIKAWQVGPQGLTDRTKTYRWPGWREQRGGVKTLSLAADGRVLVAGFGIKTGLVMLLDKDGEVAGTNNVAGNLPAMPATAIFSSAFTPAETAAVFGDSSGNVWHWDLKTPATLLTTFPPIPGREFNRVLALRFIGKTTLTAVAESGDVMTIENPEAEQPAAKISFNVQQALPAVPAGVDLRLARAEITPDGKQIVGLMVQRYGVVCGPDGKRQIPLDAGAGRFFRSAAVDIRSKLVALAVADSTAAGAFPVPRDVEIQIHAIGKGRIEGFPSTIPQPLDAEVMAFHPQDGRLFVAGGDNHELRVYDMKAPERPAPQRGASGHGRGVWGVRIAKDGKGFAWQSQRDPKAADITQLGQGPWHAFNSDLGKPRPAGELTDVRTTAGGWKVVPSDKSRFTWLAVRTVGNEAVKLELPLDPDRDQAPQCYCFFPEKAGQKTRVAIGHLYGFSVFELGDTKAERVLLATGHAGDVKSIAISDDGTWAVTGGRDQTVAGWSFAAWPSGRFGAAFAVTKADTLVVTKVDLGGPAWEMGLRENDEVKFAVRYENRRPTFLLDKVGYHHTMKLDPAQLVDSAEKTLAALAAPTPGIEYTLKWTRPGDTRLHTGLSTARHRPLWRFFPAYDANNNWSEWVGWTHRGSRYATSPGGDWLVGFQLNHPFTIVEGRPRFYAANLFKSTLHQPRTLLKLMQQRDVAKMLLDEYGENAMPLGIGDQQPMPISLKLSADKVAADGLTAAVSIEMFASNPDLMPQTVELWVNDHRVATQAWPQDKRAHTADFRVPASAFRGGDNQVTVVTVNDAGGRAVERVTVANDRTPTRPKLAGVLVGINDYKNTRVAAGERGDEFTDLKFAGKDAKVLRESWVSQAGDGKYYAAEGVTLLSEKQATRDAILAELKTLAKRTTCDDVAVVFLAGHGHWVPRPDAKGKNRRKPPMMFVFCCRDFDPAKPLETGITDEELIAALAECPARKLLLLDACHSGQTATDSVIRHLVPDGQGPAIIAACDQQESSLEHDTFGHGLFTAAVIEALTTRFADADADKTKDGLLDPQELYDYLGDRIREMLVEIKTVPTRQQPRSFPLDLPRFALAGSRK